jgi:flavin reductase (DIM6/NTAB) family NADH-FMN oxidoreductase RutF
MLFDFESLGAQERYKLLLATVMPRPMECKLMQHIPLGGFGLILGRVVMMHVRDEAVVNAEQQYIDAEKLDLIGRMEGSWYTRTTSRFEMHPMALDQWSDTPPLAP